MDAFPIWNALPHLKRVPAKAQPQPTADQDFVFLFLFAL
jgi:hypothetical protein